MEAIRYELMWAEALAETFFVMALICVIGYIIWRLIIAKPMTYRIIKEDGRYIPQRKYYGLFWTNLIDDGTTRIYNEQECRGIIERDKEKIRKVVYYE